MEIDKTLALPAPPPQVWALLLDAQAMNACVPGMESVEVVSADEYVAVMKVKIAFVSARFKLRTRIVERREPHFLRAEGTGEDTSVASSLKQSTEMHLEPREDGGTDLRLKVQVDLLGRMGTFGLSVMKTKADRLWDEFGVNLVARLGGGVPAAAAQPSDAGATADGPEPMASPAAGDPAIAVPQPMLAPARPAVPVIAAPAALSAPHSASAAAVAPPLGWWPTLLRSIGVQPASTAQAAGIIVVEVRRPDQTQIRVEWPAAKSGECATWLRDTLR